VIGNSTAPGDNLPNRRFGKSSKLGEMTRPTITSAQCRAARGLLGLTRAQVSDLALVPRVVIEDFEAEGSMPSADYPAALRRAFEQAGCVFVDENGGGPGVRLKTLQSP